MQQNRGRGRGGRGRGGRGRGRGRGGGSNASTRAAESNHGNRGSSNNGGDAAVRSYNNNNGPNNSNPNQYVAGANKRPAANRENRKAMRRERQQQAINAKTAGEDSHFWKCVQATNGRVKGPSEKVTESELFSAHTGVRGIDFGKYSDIKVDVSDPTINPATTFASLQSLVGSELSKNIKLMHYETPTPIQRFGLPAGLASRDLMCCAQTGSGKTCCFLVPMIRKLQLINNSQSGGTNNNNNNGRRGCYPQGLVLAPTRELALQIEEESRKLCYGTDVVPVCVYGGAPSRSQLSSLASTRNRKQIVVATPGRLVDFTSRGLINLSSVQVLTLDEADRMLDMGFEPQVRRIVEKFGMPPSESRLTLLFSATFPSSIQKLASDFLRKDYVWIAVGRVGSTTASIEQRILKTTKDRPAKLELLSTQLGAVEGRTLVFVQRKRTASQVRKALQRQYGISSDEIHGDRSQSQREAALERFRAGESRVLVATNVAARGLDIAGVSHVINFDLPVAAADFDDYVHRVGRTGRAGHRGTATSFYVPGYEAKHGNGPIAKLILKKLVDEKQEVPQWFATLPEVGNGGGNKGQQPQHQRPATDHRQKNRDTKIPRVVDNSNPGSGRGRGRGGRGRGGRRPNTTRN